jgi:hypothetical protein
MSDEAATLMAKGAARSEGQRYHVKELLLQLQRVLVRLA